MLVQYIFLTRSVPSSLFLRLVLLASCSVVRNIKRSFSTTYLSPLLAIRSFWKVFFSYCFYAPRAVMRELSCSVGTRTLLILASQKHTKLTVITANQGPSPSSLVSKIIHWSSSGSFKWDQRKLECTVQFLKYCSFTVFLQYWPISIFAAETCLFLRANTCIWDQRVFIRDQGATLILGGGEAENTLSY